MLFWTFRYYQSYFGLPLVADRAVLLPTAESDPALRLSVLERFFALPDGLLFLTPEERDLVARCVSAPLPRSAIVGTGLDPAPDASRDPEHDARLARAGVTTPFILYLGRVDPNKGCARLLDDFAACAGRLSRPVTLVLAGPLNMPVPSSSAVAALGYVDDALKTALLARAALLVVPSPYESLCIALLEGWNHGRAALVNGHCAVLAGQVRRAGGGLFYRDRDEFAGCLEYLLTHPDETRQMGEQGRAYVDSLYRWPEVMATLEGFLAQPVAV